MISKLKKERKQEERKLEVVYPTKFKRDYPLLKNALYIGRGINLRSQRIKEDPKYLERGAYIYLENRNSHLLGFGRTRWGKTRFIERCCVDDIEVGNSLFVIDPKGDYDLLEAIIDAVERTGRQEDFMFFSVVNPEVSIKLNPLYEMSPNAIGDALRAMSPAGKNGEFFASVAKKLGMSVATALYALGEKEIRVVDILKYLQLEKLQELYDKVETTTPESDEQERMRTDALLLLKDYLSKDQAFWSKISSTAELLLSILSTGVVGELFGKVYGNPLRDRILKERKKVIFYAYIGALSPQVGEETAGVVARLISSITHGIFGTMYDNNESFDTLFCEYWDEAKNVFYKGCEDKFNKAGGSNVAIHAFTQSKGDLEEKLGEKMTKIILDNTNWVIFSVLDSETAQEFSKASGIKRTYEPVWEEGDGRLPKLSLIPKERPLIESSEFMRMRKGCFHAFLDGSWYRGCSSLLKDRRKIWIKPLPYPDKRLIEEGFSKEEALKIRRDENKMKNFVDLVIDLRNYPYYRNFIQEERKEVKEIGRKSSIDIDFIKERLNIVKNGAYVAIKKGELLFVNPQVAKKVGVNKNVIRKIKLQAETPKGVKEFTQKAIVIPTPEELKSFPDYEFNIDFLDSSA